MPPADSAGYYRKPRLSAEIFGVEFSALVFFQDQRDALLILLFFYFLTNFFPSSF